MWINSEDASTVPGQMQGNDDRVMAVALAEIWGRALPSVMVVWLIQLILRMMGQAWAISAVQRHTCQSG